MVDTFAGSGTTAIAALSLERNCVLIDNQPEYYRIALQRLIDEQNLHVVEETAAEMGGNDNGSFKAINKPVQRRLLDKDSSAAENSNT